MINRVRRASRAVAMLCAATLSTYAMAANDMGTSQPLDGGALAEPSTMSRMTVRPPGLEDYRFGNAPTGMMTFDNFYGMLSQPPGALFQQSAGDKSEDAARIPCLKEGNPVVLATGNKVEPEVDFATTGEMPLGLVRVWNARRSDTGIFGKGWYSDFDRKLAIVTTAPHSGTCVPAPGAPGCSLSFKPTYVYAIRPDGRQVKFIDQGTSYREDKPSPVSLVSFNPITGWIIKTDDNRIETYAASGLVTHITDLRGVGWTLNYGGTNGTQLQSVVHTSGRTVRFEWQNGTVSRIIAPDGNAYSYTYITKDVTPVYPNGRSLLSEVTYPDGLATTTYAYSGGGSGEYLAQLAGKSIAGVRYSYFEYDAAGFYATATYHAGNVERNTFAYTKGSDGKVTSTLHTNPLGKQTRYNFEHGDPTTTEGLASANCPASAKSTTYDANGYVDLVTDFAGAVTDYDYAANGQLTRRIDAKGTPAQRTFSYHWEATGNRLLKTTLVGVSERTLAYGADDRLTSETFTDIVTGRSLTTTYSYTYHASGMLASEKEDGPVAGDGDSRTSRYDNLGNLVSVMNGFGHTTSYSLHTGLGSPRRVVDPNGLRIDYGYDARGRVTTRSAYLDGSHEAKYTFTYLSNGLIGTQTSPAGITTRYLYDAAQRLTEFDRREVDGTYSRESYTYNANSNVTQVLRSTTDYPGDTRVIGRVEAITASSGSYALEGWACTTSSGAPLSINIYAGGQAATGTLVGTYLANAPSEEAIAAACSASGTNYRFKIPLSDDLRRSFEGKALFVYGISPAGNGNTLLDSSGAVTMPAQPPPAAVQLTAPTIVNADFSVSWTAALHAATYTMQEQVGGGAWSSEQTTTATSTAIHPPANGSYTYRVKACNSGGCSDWSNSATVQVAIPAPSAVTGFTMSYSVNTGSTPPVTTFYFSWNPSADATRYEMQEGAGAPFAALTQLTRQGGPAGTDFAIRACGRGGCSGWTRYTTPVSYGAVYAGMSVATGMVPGQIYSARVSFKNTGNVVWNNADGYALGSQNPQDNGAWGAGRIPLPRNVAPNETVDFNFQVTAPAAGTYAFQWRMVRDGFTWFGDYSDSLSIVVATQAPPVPTGLSVATSTTGMTPPQFYHTARWNAAAGASTYQLRRASGTSVEQLTNGQALTWYGGPVSSNIYDYSVRACNGAACSDWSASVRPK